MSRGARFSGAASWTEQRPRVFALDVATRELREDRDVPVDANVSVGDQRWRLEVLATVADIRPDAEQIEISVTAHPPGKVWLDDGAVDVVQRYLTGTLERKDEFARRSELVRFAVRWAEERKS